MRLVGLLCLLGAAAGAASAPTLCGKWRSQMDQAVTWSFAQDGDQLHVQEVAGSKLKADFTCNLEGRECAIKDAGHAEKVTLYLNGMTLVELCTRGNNVVKRRFALAEDGKTMELEVMPIAPPGRAEKAEFARED